MKGTFVDGKQVLFTQAKSASTAQVTFCLIIVPSRVLEHGRGNVFMRFCYLRRALRPQYLPREPMWT